MILPIKYKLYNNKLWVRWGKDEIWKEVRWNTKGSTYTPISQRFGENFKWSKTKPDGWFGKYLYGEIVKGIVGHNGIDFIANNGTTLYAPEDIEITKLCTNDGYGIKAKSANGFHRFWHLQGFACKEGDKIKKGDIIGFCDNTGQYTTGAHLHWDFKPLNYNDDNGYHGTIDHSGFIEDLDIKELPYKNGTCLLVKPHGRFYVVEDGDLVFYDSEKQADRHIPIVDFFIRKNKEGLPPNFIKVINEEELLPFKNLIK